MCAVHHPHTDSLQAPLLSMLTSDDRADESDEFGNKPSAEVRDWPACHRAVTWPSRTFVALTCASHVH